MKPELQSFSGSRGIIYVAFGEEYLRSAAASACSAREHTSLPIRVVSNLANPEQFNWPDGVTFEFVDKPDEANREIRTQIDEFTPFDRTLLADADLLFTDEITVLPLDWLEHWDVVAVTYRSVDCEHHKNRQWADVVDAVGTPDHFTFCGGVLYFKKNRVTHDMFRWWFRYWRADGRARDMPHLFRALWRSEVRFLPLPGENIWIGVRHGHFHHAAGNQRVAGLPKITKFKPNGRDASDRMRIWERVT